MSDVKGIGGAMAAGILPPAIPDRDHDPKKIADAAQQFESLLIGQLLRASHGPDGTGWMGTGDDQAGSQAIDMAEEQLSQTLARQGGLGLAKLVVAGLRQKADAASAKSQHATAPSVKGPASPSPVPGVGSASRGSGGGGTSTGNFAPSAGKAYLALGPSGHSLTSGGSVANPATGNSSRSNYTQPVEVPARTVPSNRSAQKLQP